MQMQRYSGKHPFFCPFAYHFIEQQKHYGHCCSPRTVHDEEHRRSQSGETGLHARPYIRSFNFYVIFKLFLFQRNDTPNNKRVEEATECAIHLHPRFCTNRCMQNARMHVHIDSTVIVCVLIHYPCQLWLLFLSPAPDYFFILHSKNFVNCLFNPST